MSRLRTASIDEGIVDRAAALYRRWNQSHGVDVNDAILAATAIQTGGRICCLSRRHYPMPGVTAGRAW